MITENKNFVDLARKFIDEHDSNENWSPFDRVEKMAIIMYAKWLESKNRGTFWRIRIRCDELSEDIERTRDVAIKIATKFVNWGILKVRNEFGKFKKVTDIDSGISYKVPTRDIIEIVVGRKIWIDIQFVTIDKID